MSEQNPPVKTVKQEVETILRLTQEAYAAQTEAADDLVKGNAEFHEAVISVLDDIIERYVAPEPELDPEATEFQVGAKYRLTGKNWQDVRGLQSGDIVTVIELDKDGDGVIMKSDGSYNYLMQPDTGYGAVLVEGADPTIRVGDTVRTKGHPFYEDGMEFKVTKVVPSQFTSRSDGITREFFVGGDRNGYGVWDIYLEKVHA